MPLTNRGAAVASQFLGHASSLIFYVGFGRPAGPVGSTGADTHAGLRCAESMWNITRQ